jgi:hypothetical protein
MSVLEFFSGRARMRFRRSVELRALCNEVPRTPPGPEGSNGTGYASGAADHPKFLSPRGVFSRKFRVVSKEFGKWWLGLMAPFVIGNGEAKKDF